MREIKFRAWDKVIEKFYYSDKEPSMWQFFLYLHDKGIRHFEVQQYTGLKDKNGKEIYEGDILSFGDYSDGSGKCLHRVIWNEEDACFDTQELFFVKGKFGLDPFSEVIGNVYSNPELLGAQV